MKQPGDIPPPANRMDGFDFSAAQREAIAWWRAGCSENHGAVGPRIYGEDPDGFVLCRACRVPLFYCDLGGRG